MSFGTARRRSNAPSHILLAMLLAATAGCASFSTLLHTNWSENYALDAYGATANHEALIDGKPTTVASTPVKADPREFVVQFPEPKRVRRIRIVNHNLYRFTVSYWDAERSDWQVVKTVWQRRDVDSFERSIQPLFTITGINFVTDRIRIAVSRTVEDQIVNKLAPDPSDKILDHVQRTVGGTWMEFWRVIVESPARVREVEVYGVLPRETKS
ncbi:hypothetical protein FJZ36_02635 [Candidatus Poribacteria bacterium]|nr:hypothetical protein [Candidatus Poribacteria bacterium]